jgi:hypothetical protein
MKGERERERERERMQLIPLIKSSRVLQCTGSISVREKTWQHLHASAPKGTVLLQEVKETENLGIRKTSREANHTFRYYKVYSSPSLPLL